MVKPRLEQAKAECEKISATDKRIKSFSMIDVRLEEAIIKTVAKLLILDPIQAYLDGGMDMKVMVCGCVLRLWQKQVIERALER